MRTHEHHRTSRQPEGTHAGGHGGDRDGSGTLWRQAISATLHCLTGCAIGEVLGLAIGTALGWSNLATIALAIALAFVFGYSFTIWPVLRTGLPLGTAIGVAWPLTPCRSPSWR